MSNGASPLDSHSKGGTHILKLLSTLIDIQSLLNVIFRVILAD